MMKKLFLLLSIGLLASIGFAQTAPEGELQSAYCQVDESSCVISTEGKLYLDYGKIAIMQLSKPRVDVTVLSDSGRIVSKRHFFIERSKLDELHQLVLKNKLWKYNYTQPFEPNTTISASSDDHKYVLKFTSGELQTLAVHYRDTPKEKNVVKAYQTVRGFFEQLLQENPAQPEAQLIYCSCAETPFGVPDRGKTYYELVADVGKAPKVIVCTNAGMENETKKEYPVTETQVTNLQLMLQRMDVSDIDGYNQDDRLMGGSLYRVYMEYADGKKINATWQAEKPRSEAEKAYSTILSYLYRLTK
ncbi:MAG: hypothetical protein IKN15_12500 [Bacteroidaceae bacterium]|nr:hypothetical protein [Bacteroidaceae bacterium]